MLQRMVVVRILLVFSCEVGHWFEVKPALCEICRRGAAVDDLVVRHSEAKALSKFGGEHLRVDFTSGALLEHDPLPIYQPPALFVTADIGQFRRWSAELLRRILLGEAVERAVQSYICKVVLRKADLCPAKVLLLIRLHPVVVGNCRSMDTEDRV